MADLVTTGAMDSANLPPLQLDSIQTSGITFRRWSLPHVCTLPSSLYVLLEALLLVFHAGRGMTIAQHHSGPTSNDLPCRLVAQYPGQIRYYQLIAQSVEDVQDIENAPAACVGSYLLESGQMRPLTSIRVYGVREESREQMRRPPRFAHLMFGVLFSN